MESKPASQKNTQTIEGAVKETTSFFQEQHPTAML